MIRWNKWTRDYTYTYEWHEGVWRLIHKKSNRPVASWFGKMYSMFSKNMGGFIKAIASRSCSSNRESKYLEKSYRHSITVRVHSSLAGEITTRVRS